MRWLMWLNAALLLSGCSPKKSELTDAAKLPVAGVRVQTVESKRQVATEEVVGTVRPKLHSVIEAKATGRIEKILAVPAQRVRAGELLVQLDAAEIKATLDQAVAMRDQADNDLKRFSALLQQQAATRAEFEAVQARQRVAQATVVQMQSRLSDTAITAPFDGIITRKLADAGDLARPGKPLLEMEDPGVLRLEAEVPEALIGRFEPGARLPVSIVSAGRDLEGVVTEIAPTADPASRTFLVKLALPLMPGLRAGEFGRALVPVGETSVLRVPITAVVQRGQMELVFVVTNRQAQLRLVKTGKRVGNDVELVAGVNAGEQVVIENAAHLVDGQPVQIP